MSKPSILWRVEDPLGVYDVQAVEILVSPQFGRAHSEYQARLRAYEIMAGCEHTQVDQKVLEEAIASFSIREIPARSKLDDCEYCKQPVYAGEKAVRNGLGKRAHLRCALRDRYAPSPGCPSTVEDGVD